MRIYVFWIIIGISVALLASNTQAQTPFEVGDNIVENTSAKEVLVDRPEKWNSYIGNGTFEFGFTDEESHSGKYSAYLTVLAFGDNDGVNAAIMVGHTNGYDGTKAYECEENTKYFYAFYAKAQDHTEFKDPLRLLLWCWKAGGASGDRVFPPRASVSLTSEWTRYEGSFVTPAGAKTFALGTGPYGTKAAKIEATFYLDDVYLGLTPPPPDPEAVDSSGKLAVTWGEIKALFR